MRLSPAEEEASALVASDVVSTLSAGFQPDEIRMLGSRTTGLATPLSDFDFSIMPKQEQEIYAPRTMISERVSKRKSMVHLTKVADILRRSPDFVGVGLIHARIPLCKARHTGTALVVQFQSMVPFQAAQEQTKACITEMPSLRPLYIALRMCLEIRDLTTVFTGGLGSYAILMMTVTALKHANAAFHPQDLGGQLLHVLKFWGSADLYRYAYSTQPPQVIEKDPRQLDEQEYHDETEEGREEREGEEQHEEHILVNQVSDSQLQGMEVIRKRSHERAFLLCLQDPANHFNDLGTNSYAIKQIQATFAAIHATLSWKAHGLDMWQKTNTGAPTSSVLSKLVGARYAGFEKSRIRVARYADPKRRDDDDYTFETINSEQQFRALDYRKRNGLDLYFDPEAITGYGLVRKLDADGPETSARSPGHGANIKEIKESARLLGFASKDLTRRAPFIRLYYGGSEYIARKELTKVRERISSVAGEETGSLKLMPEASSGNEANQEIPTRQTSRAWYQGTPEELLMATSDAKINPRRKSGRQQSKLRIHKEPLTPGWPIVRYNAGVTVSRILSSNSPSSRKVVADRPADLAKTHPDQKRAQKAKGQSSEKTTPALTSSADYQDRALDDMLF